MMMSDDVGANRAYDLCYANVMGNGVKYKEKFNCLPRMEAVFP